MSIKLICCNKSVEISEVWLLQDIKGFTARKLCKGKCPVCGDDVVTLIEKRINDEQIFINLLTGIEAVKTIYREKKRRVFEVPGAKSDNLYGWIYGRNIEIRNKNKEVTMIRQYSSDFYGKKTISKKIFVKNSLSS